jgi:uncharacterized surface protein with fasciclin (FAS1) repeats
MGEKLFILDTASRSGIFQTFTRLLEGSSLEKQLRSTTCFTLFAPADIAFVYVSPETLNQLVQADFDGTLADMLSYHVVPGEFPSAQLKGLSSRRIFKLETVLFMRSIASYYPSSAQQRPQREIHYAI